MKNIVLTGFMGTGKTAVGAELSRLTGFKVVDVDSEIEKSAGMTISRIFEKHGEPAFRDMETGEIKKISGGKGLIIATGGGAVLREENIAALRAGGHIVCLSASPETILKRVEGNSDRPLLQVKDPLAKISDMLAQRKPFYEKADLTVETGGKTPLEVAKEILERVRETDG